VPSESCRKLSLAGGWKYKGVVFGPLAARYVRLEADAVNGTGGAQATEVVVGPPGDSAMSQTRHGDSAETFRRDEESAS